MTGLLLAVIVGLVILVVVAATVSFHTPLNGPSISTRLSRTGARDAMLRAQLAPYRRRARWGIQITVVRQEED